jgi:hypothetical protein
MRSYLLILQFLLLKVLFVSLLIIIFIPVETADCSENSYYSIHLASFKKLKNANNFVNAMTNKGKLLFWKKTDVPGKGVYYRVFLGKYETRDQAVEFWNKLNEEGSVEYFGIYEFYEEEGFGSEGETSTVTLSPEGGVQQVTMSVAPDERFVDNGDGTVTDKKTNLMWVKNGWRLDFFSAVNWRDAIKKCADFKYSGYTDWRLPTIKEWESLLDISKEFPALAEPNPFENIIVHMPYWSNTGYGSTEGASPKTATRAYAIMLYYGRITHQNINRMGFVLPVRSLN